MNVSFVKDLLWGMFFLILQVVLVRHLRIFDTEANLLWLYIIFLVSTKKRTYSLLMTALLSFIFDAIIDTWGLHLFSNVLVVFLAFNFIPRVKEVRLLTAQVLIVLLVSSLAVNSVLIGMSDLIAIYQSNMFFWQMLIGNSLFTAVLGAFLYNFSSAAQGNS